MRMLCADKEKLTQMISFILEDGGEGVLYLLIYLYILSFCYYEFNIFSFNICNSNAHAV